jgi:exosome complex component CSL4
MTENTANSQRKSVSPILTRQVLPGDRLATIEEFEPGQGSTIEGDSVISTVIGQASPDMANRTMNVKTDKSVGIGVPVTGDYIVGKVQSAQPSIAQIQIESLNETPSNKQFTGMLSMRDERRRRTSSPIKAGDVVRARVLSTKNSIFQLTVDAPNCGVLYTVCCNCGKDVFAISRDRVKCRECGWVDERLLSEDFVRSSRGQ